MKFKRYLNNNHPVNTTKNNKTYINMNQKNDECYTRKNEADRLVKYLVKYRVISKRQRIWLPFNDYKSAIYCSLFKNNFKNLLATNDDFYKIANKTKYDIIISNPPFSHRSKLFNKLIELNKPFILLQPIMFFNNGTCIKILTKFGAKFGALCPNKRMSFERNIGFLCPNKNMGFIVNGKEYDHTSAFYSFWLCFKTKVVGFVDMEIESEAQ